MSLREQQQEAGSKVLKKIKKADIWQFLRFCIVGMSNAVPLGLYQQISGAQAHLYQT